MENGTRSSTWHEGLIRSVAVIALMYGAYWIVWRWTYTLNTSPKAIVPSLILLLAETWAYLNTCMFVFLTWKLTNRDPGPPLAGRTVDVFITVFNEPLEVLRRTALGARAIRYPHRVFVLDDGKRDDVLAMTKELGIGYIRRTGNANAKAGNLNHAIALTSGEFILQFDADHVPLPQIVDRLIGYFRDPRMALVQSPQDFYNVDSFSHVMNADGRRLWEENRIFYSLIQPGRDHWNASFFCGSCGMIRRSALESIGGFASQTIIEDMETTLQLHARGFETAYHRETLAYGLAPGAADAYHVQRLRWGQGAMQVLRKLKPLTARGLTLPQRISYFAGTACYFEGWQKAVFYLMPLFYLFTGILPVGGDQHAFLIRLFPYIISSIIAFELLSRGTGYLLLSERYAMLRVWTYMMAALAIFTSRPLKFNVTPKGKSGVPPMAYIPQLVLLVVSLIAPVWATIAYHERWINYTAPGWGSMAFWMNGFWAAWNCYFAFSVVRHSLKMKQQRGDHRFAEQLPVLVRLEGVSPGVPALTVDLNPTGVGLRSTTRIEPGTTLAIHLPLVPHPVSVSGMVKHVMLEHSQLGDTYVHGVAFDEMPAETSDQIERYCLQHAMPIWRAQHRQSVDILKLASETVRDPRVGRRRSVGLPGMVQASQSTADGVTEPLPSRLFILADMSRAGARIIGDAPITPGTSVWLHVAGIPTKGRGTVRNVQLLETPVAVLFSMGVEFAQASGQ